MQLKHEEKEMIMKKFYLKHLVIVVSFTVAISITAEGCLFGLLGGSSKNATREMASIIGTVVYKKAGSDSTAAKFDSLETGLVQYWFDGMKIGATSVSKGHFTLEGISPRCCYTIVIKNVKTGEVLGVDSTVSLEPGPNVLSFKTMGSTGEKLLIDRDTTGRARLKIAPRPVK